MRPLRAAAADGHRPRGAGLRCHGVVADVVEPDVLDRAGPLAVNPVSGVMIDDHVLDGGAVVELEQRLGRPLVLRAGGVAIDGEVAAAAAVVKRHLPVVGPADLLRRRDRHRRPRRRRPGRDHARPGRNERACGTGVPPRAGGAAGAGAPSALCAGRAGRAGGARRAAGCARVARGAAGSGGTAGRARFARGAARAGRRAAAARGRPASSGRAAAGGGTASGRASRSVAARSVPARSVFAAGGGPRRRTAGSGGSATRADPASRSVSRAGRLSAADRSEGKNQGRQQTRRRPNGPLAVAHTAEVFDAITFGSPWRGRSNWKEVERVGGRSLWSSSRPCEPPPRPVEKNSWPLLS